MHARNGNERPLLLWLIGVVAGLLRSFADKLLHCYARRVCLYVPSNEHYCMGSSRFCGRTPYTQGELTGHRRSRDLTARIAVAPLDRSWKATGLLPSWIKLLWDISS